MDKTLKIHQSRFQEKIRKIQVSGKCTGQINSGADWCKNRHNTVFCDEELKFGTVIEKPLKKIKRQNWL